MVSTGLFTTAIPTARKKSVGFLSMIYPPPGPSCVTRTFVNQVTRLCCPFVTALHSTSVHLSTSSVLLTLLAISLTHFYRLSQNLTWTMISGSRANKKKRIPLKAFVPFKSFLLKNAGLITKKGLLKLFKLLLSSPTKRTKICVLFA